MWNNLNNWHCLGLLSLGLFVVFLLMTAFAVHSSGRVNQNEQKIIILESTISNSWTNDYQLEFERALKELNPELNIPNRSITLSFDGHNNLDTQLMTENAE